MFKKFGFLLWLLIPLICIFAYLFFSFLVGMGLHGILYPKYYNNFTITFPPYFTYLILIILILSKYHKNMWLTLKKNLSSILFLSVLWIVTYMFIYSGQFLIPGWNERGPQMYNDNNWWYLSRRSPIYPFDLWGQNFVTNSTMNLPKSYMFSWLYKENSWVGIISYKNFVHTIVLSFLQSWIILTFYKTKIEKGQISI